MQPLGKRFGEVVFPHRIEKVAETLDVRNAHQRRNIDKGICIKLL